MATVGELVRRLFPDDAGWQRDLPWPDVPSWPPDLFAVTAALVERAQCYVNPRYTSHWRPSCLFDDRFRKHVSQVGADWRTLNWEKALPELEKPWLVFFRYRDEIVETRPEQRGGEARPWWDAAITLMVIADEAAQGMGFLPDRDRRPLVDFFIDEMTKMRVGKASLHLPHSICLAVPPSEACVQPKTRTADVGCTLRSLSHNLALLPQAGAFATRWFPVPGGSPTLKEEAPFNIMLVPFPYELDGNCLCENVAPSTSNARFFETRQTWLPPGSVEAASDKIAAWIGRLTREAKRQVRNVHGVVLPEGSLSAPIASSVAKKLTKYDIELFITGVLDHRNRSSPINAAWAVPYMRRKIPFIAKQSKHHRWRLDKGQILRYSLGDSLNPAGVFWEKIDVSERACSFFVFRHGASLAALICEDLARTDPAGTVIRSIGPNLVIVLLMDGPQMESRWPGKYAAVLADDPGSSVLTLTSLGMVRRSVRPGAAEPREIALWKEPGHNAEELKLPLGSHALLLTLSISAEEQFTLDGRSDGGNSVKISLTGVSQVCDPKGGLP